MSTKIALGALVALITGAAAHAGAPQGLIIEAQISFTGEGGGTFTATSPLCSTGIVRTTNFAVFNPAVRYTVREEFVCDDNSGSFFLHYHPQGRPDPTFTVSGPWSIPGGVNTGAYVGLSGHGDFGVVVTFDENGVPQTGTETFVGFVQLN
jgi:hypothetical protein